ncbi:hypothetical protein ACP70R_048742 [Stipagrostis hirtigluma subsp. patula]
MMRRRLHLNDDELRESRHELGEGPPRAAMSLEERCCPVARAGTEERAPPDLAAGNTKPPRPPLAQGLCSHRSPPASAAAACLGRRSRKASSLAPILRGRRSP